NQIVTPRTIDTNSERTNWEMRELIVQKGLPRALVHQREKRQKSFSNPDGLLLELQGFAKRFGSLLRFMNWPRSFDDRKNVGKFDNWQEWEKKFVLERWIPSVVGTPLDPNDLHEHMLGLIWSKRPEAKEKPQHIRLPDETPPAAVNLQVLLENVIENDLFVGDAILEQILDLLRFGKARTSRTPLITPGDPGNSKFLGLVKSGSMGRRFSDDERQLVEDWIKSLTE
ncbi:unnamed protein product, partial [marine sediment metagenome]